MPAAISIRGLGKRYRVNHAVERAPYRTLRDSLASAATAPLRRLRGETNGHSNEFWALKDVDFDVEQGDVVGIIGRNGAGKSTLLKILSRITSPTTGQVEINGRVGSLLEVGTGFHPELTGRENVYLNGTILGMAKREIDRQFDEIVEFSGVETFLDTPIKRYSSGMQVRLAFAVAAHLALEILIIDEVLAVGDAEFQKKCLGRMQDVASQGRTVLFVSHNMAAVKRLCSRGIVLYGGNIVKCGDAAAAVSFYIDRNDSSSALKRGWRADTAPGNEKVRLLEIVVEPLSGEDLDTDSGFLVRWTFQSLREHSNFGTTVEIRNSDDVPVIHEGTRITETRVATPGVYQAEMRVPPLLNSGRYKLDLLFGENQRYLLLRLDNILAFDILHSASHGRLTPTPGILRNGFGANVRVLKR